MSRVPVFLRVQTLGREAQHILLRDADEQTRCLSFYLPDEWDEELSVSVMRNSSHSGIFIRKLARACMAMSNS